MENEQIKKLCMRCMHELDSDSVCPYCGNYERKDIDLSCMVPGNILEQKYLVGEPINKNSEGIGYIGYDISNKCVIYIREFMPEKFCVRGNGSQNIEKIAPYEDLFDDYMEKFLSCARALARFRDVSAIAPVYDIFKANNTAYYVTDFIRGMTLSEFIKKRRGKLDWETTRALFMPTLSALAVLHKANIMHLGLSPETLIVTDENKMKICNFSINEVRQSNALLVPELFEGYAAPEQYVIRERLTESADVYGFCACMLFALSGKRPPVSSKRKLDSKLLVSNDVLDSIPSCAVSAMANGLKVSPEERTRSFEKLHEEFNPIKELVENESSRDDVETNSNNKKNILYWTIISCLIIAIVAFIIGIFNMGKAVPRKQSSLSKDESNESSLASESTENNNDSSHLLTPNLIGVALKDAQNTATKNGNYQVMVSEKQYSDTVVADRIITQFPEAGTKIEKGEIIVVNVSKGAKFRKLPSIEGLSLSAAVSKLNSLGFVTKKEEEYSDSVNKGAVVGYKDYSSGDELEDGSDVVIIVSKGRKEKL